MRALDVLSSSGMTTPCSAGGTSETRGRALTETSISSPSTLTEVTSTPSPTRQVDAAMAPSAASTRKATSASSMSEDWPTRTDVDDAPPTPAPASASAHETRRRSCIATCVSAMVT